MIKSGKQIYWLSGIVCLTIIAYWPVFENGFINYDDNWYIQSNQFIKELSLKNITSIFFQYYQGQYSPLTMILLAAIYHIGELNPFAFHFTSVLLHLVNTCLVFLFIQMLVNNTQSVGRTHNTRSWSIEIALITAALFGVQTLHVESVAWASSMKIVLYTTFYLAALITYIKYVRYNKQRFYYCSIFFLVLSILSKEQAVILPVTLIAIDFLLGRKILSKNVLIEKAPFFALSLIFGIVAVFARESGEGIYSTFFPYYGQFLFASYGFVLYFIKLIFPFHLSVFYPYPENAGGEIPLQFWLSPLVVIAIIVLVIYTIKHSRQVAFGILFFVINIVLLLQLLPVRDHIIADRYTYMPSIGFFFLIGWGYKTVAENCAVRQGMKHYLNKILFFVLSAYVVMLSVLTYNRCGVWSDSLTLWNNVIAQYSNVPVAYLNRGMAKAVMENYGEAKQDFDKAIELAPYSIDAYMNRGNINVISRDFSAAVVDYNKVLQLDTSDFEAYFNRGSSRYYLKDMEGACNDWHRALILGHAPAEALINKLCK